MKLKYDELLSNFACFAFNCNLRHYDEEADKKIAHYVDPVTALLRVVGITFMCVTRDGINVCLTG